MDTMIHLNELPWYGVAKDLTKENIRSSKDIIDAADLDWEVDYTSMNTAIHGTVPGWNAIYRTDNKDILGVVNKARPKLVQNSQMFNPVEKMIGSSLDIEAASSIHFSESVFASFRVREQYKILDDDVDTYLVVVNNHLKADGKVTVFNTPVRVVCQNILSYALSKALYSLRVPVTYEASINSTLAVNLIQNVHDASKSLEKRAAALVSKKVDASYLDKVLDVLFPLQLMDGLPLPTKANEKMEMQRDAFITECMGADNLANYRGTQWQVVNALIDYDTHMFRSGDKAYDLNYRMNLMPGVGVITEPSKVIQFLKIADKLAA